MNITSKITLIHEGADEGLMTTRTVTEIDAMGAALPYILEQFRAFLAAAGFVSHEIISKNDSKIGEITHSSEGAY